MSGQHLLALLILTPALRVSAVPVSLESGILILTSCVKHAAQAGGMALAGQDVCLDWLWAVLG